MLHLTFDDLTHAFRTHKRAFHLEVRDDYSGVAGEADRVRRFLAGQPQDPAASARWHALIWEVTASGCAVQRVRVISEPHGDYTRFSVGTTSTNIEVGEDIRWLPRQDAPPGLPDDDWWLFDDEMAAYTVFNSDGTAAPGWAAITDPVITAHYAQRRDELWSKAIPHAEYDK
ncbi:DUF6879 family protein [Nocardia gamkensis]|uniref:DUF6879 domain-containing protein n=1 Tax=Nocardia gamkensis TaxID=352869 RepID=A0A7X6R2P6_9NOCA|nr:DUF6879 family protein [Nocardia gamkensis]NKY26575.1 hypothetical protein [Nocardia gamkensis]NQE67593.1 hypothetical protein [Nocardia gamkensis]